MSTLKVEQRLKKYNFKSKLIVISNGISDYYLQSNQRTTTTDPFTILSIGRFSNEKDQKTLIKAIGRSKYKDRIKLILAGKGPLKNEYISLCQRLKINAQLGFYSRNDLKQIMDQSNIVVHLLTWKLKGWLAWKLLRLGVYP